MNTDKERVELKAEVERLTEESASRKESIRIQMQQIERLTKINEETIRSYEKILHDERKINEELVKGLTDAIERMGRARAILTDREGQPDCWQMLNADNLKSILNP